MLTDDPEDQGAFGSVVLSPIFNVQSAGLALRRRVLWSRMDRYKRLVENFERTLCQIDVETVGISLNS